MSSVLRGLEVLEVLAGMTQPSALSAITERTSLSQSQTFRILSELERAGYVDHLGRAGYRIAGRSIALATTIGPRHEILRIVYPVMAKLAATTGEASILHLRSGRARVLVLGVPAPSGPHVDPAMLLGERSPLAAGASGRVILAHLPERDLADVDLAGLSESELAEIRDRGYETSFGENHPGVNGVSGPLLADDDRTDVPVALGSITLAGPASRMSAERMERLVKPLLAACRELAPRLGSALGPSLGRRARALDL